MKKVIRLTESDLTRIVRRVIKENEEEWISQSEDMESDTDFSKMELEQSSKEATEQLSPEEQDMLRDFIESNGIESLQSIVKDSLESVLTEEDEMGDNEYEIRSIIDKIIGYSSVGAALAIVPAAMFISGGIAAALGVYALASNTLRDAAWFKRKGYDKYQSGHHYGKSDKSRNNK
jgi:replication-associated recombination protein RarA